MKMSHLVSSLSDILFRLSQVDMPLFYFFLMLLAMP